MERVVQFLRNPLLFVAAAVIFVDAEPVVMNGTMIPEAVGQKIASLRIVDTRGKPISFQIDEITAGNEYVCPQGEQPNGDSADGVFDTWDELVFLFEDADTVNAHSGIQPSGSLALMTLNRGNQKRFVWIVKDSSMALSSKCYLWYDHKRHYLSTPYYYSQFAKDRFHFTSAGSMDFAENKHIDLTRELRVDIRLRALWGLLPIHYTEDNIVCKVKRYKAGPVRLIRRGDFYLDIGLGFKGSEAVVYQLCYPDLVKVPVRARLPVRFSLFFKDAFIEMTPVIRFGRNGFRFNVPSAGFSGGLAEDLPIDTVIKAFREKRFNVSNGQSGFEWVVAVSADDSYLSGGGYVLRRPSLRSGAAECGYRLMVTELPRGTYDIVNWVFFPFRAGGRSDDGLKTLNRPVTINIGTRSSVNLLASSKK